MPAYRLSLTVLALSLLAGCNIPTPIVEQRVPGKLPGAGTYVWAEEPASPERFMGSVAPQVAAAGAVEIRKAVERALDNRGYEPGQPGKANWKISYEARVATKSEDLAPEDKMLVARMECNLHDCYINHQWEHFGPPQRGEAVRVFRESQIRVRIHNARSDELVWQGSVASELNEQGLMNRAELNNAVRHLLNRLPLSPRDPAPFELESVSAN